MADYESGLTPNRALDEPGAPRSRITTSFDQRNGPELKGYRVERLPEVEAWLMRRARWLAL